MWDLNRWHRPLPLLIVAVAWCPSVKDLQGYSGLEGGIQLRPPLLDQRLVRAPSEAETLACVARKRHEKCFGFFPPPPEGFRREGETFLPSCAWVALVFQVCYGFCRMSGTQLWDITIALR